MQPKLYVSLNIYSHLLRVFACVIFFLYAVLHSLSNKFRIPLLLLVSTLIFIIRPELIFIPLMIVLIRISFRNWRLPFTGEAFMLVIYMLTLLPAGIFSMHMGSNYLVNQRTPDTSSMRSQEGNFSTSAIRLFQYNPSVLCVKPLIPAVSLSLQG